MTRRGFLKSLFGIAASAALSPSLEALAETLALPGEPAYYQLRIYGVALPIRTPHIDDALKAAQTAIFEMDWQKLATAQNFDPTDTGVHLEELAALRELDRRQK